MFFTLCIVKCVIVGIKKKTKRANNNENPNPLAVEGGLLCVASSPIWEAFKNNWGFGPWQSGVYASWCSSVSQGHRHVHLHIRHQAPPSLSRRGVQAAASRTPAIQTVHLTTGLSLITKAGPCSRLAEVKRRWATEKHVHFIPTSSGVEKYPVWVLAGLAFYSAWCFVLRKKKNAS